MNRDPYSTVWVSHSSIVKFLQCPRAYYLAHVYKNPKTGNRISIMQPPLALGQAVHDTLESLSSLPREERFNKPLLDRLEEAWEKISGKKGGFKNEAQEAEYKERGKRMIARVVENPGILLNKAVKIRPRIEKDRASKFDLPHYVFSEPDNIILCGKIDWLEYLENENSVHIVDFKTGRNEEDEGSLQLSIYHLLAKNCQSFNISKASYWYLDRENTPTEVVLPDAEEAYEKVLQTAKRIKLARQLQSFKCPKEEIGCYVCQSFEMVYRGGGEFIGTSDSKQDIFIIP